MEQDDSKSERLDRLNQALGESRERAEALAAGEPG